MMKKIILASSSPRRKEILEMVGLKFEIDPSNYEEVLDQNLNPSDLAEKLSLGKAQGVAKRHANSIIIGADTVAFVNGKNIGKPHIKENAIKILTELSGKKHLIVTGFTIIDTEIGKKVTRSVKTNVYFRSLTSEEINEYVDTGEPLDKGGAYAIQGKGSLLIEKIEGDYFNVVGLPISKVVEVLKTEFNTKIF